MKTNTKEQTQGGTGNTQTEPWTCIPVSLSTERPSMADFTAWRHKLGKCFSSADYMHGSAWFSSGLAMQ